MIKQRGQSGWAISLADKTVRLPDLRANPDRYTRLLADAHAQKTAHCGCREPMLPIVVRCRGARYHLACWPTEGPRHDPRCPFFHLAPALSGRQAYSDAAIHETATGTAIQFAEPLTVHVGDTSSDQVLGDGSGSSKRRRSVGALGVLHHLWESARLNAWNARQRHRTWPTVAEALGEQLADTVVSGHRGNEAVYVVPPYRADAAAANMERFDRFLGSLRRNATQIRRGLVLGELKAVRPTRYGVAYQLTHQSPQRQIFAAATVDDNLRRRHPVALGQAGERAGGRPIVLLYIERSPNGYAVALGGATMLTTPDYIPADSSYEIRMAGALTAAGRSYIKPVAYDQAEAVLPDFVLTDQPDAYVEVWGLPGRDFYEQRKARKLAHYQRHARTLIEWDVAQPFPTIPPAPTTRTTQR